jgi:hypothetical protein
VLLAPLACEPFPEFFCGGAVWAAHDNDVSNIAHRSRRMRAISETPIRNFT